MSFQRDFLSRKISDPLAKIVSDLAKEQFSQNFQIQNIDTLNIQVVSVKTKSKTNSKDKFHLSIKPYAENQQFFNAMYPDYEDLRLQLKGENSDRLRDYSLKNNEAYLWSDYQVAEIYTRDSPNNMAKHEIVAYMNGTHYVRVRDNPILRLVDIVTNETEKDGFTIMKRFNPMMFGQSKQSSKILSQKIDSSQNRYGHSINMDDEGNIYFYVKYNYRQYFCKLTAINFPAAATNASFRMENFKSANFKTELQALSEIITYDYDLVARFDFTTKECRLDIWHTDVNTGIPEHIASASSLSGANSLPPNLQLHLPLQEGKWSETKTLPNNLPMDQVFDSSVNQFIGTINNSGATAIWQPNNTLHNTRAASGQTYISVPNHANLNAFTEFTISFYVKMDDLTSDAVFRSFFNKGWGVNGGIIIYRSPNSSTIACEFRTDANVRPSCIFTNVVQDTNHWYHIVMRWKSGEKLKLTIDGTEIQSSITASGTVTSASSLLIGTSTASDSATIINFMMYNRQLTTSEVELLTNYGEHLAQFPENLEPQRLVNPSPVPITNPLVTIYDNPKQASIVETDYVYINSPELQTPFVKNYDCPDGTSEEIPFTKIYDIPLGSTTAPDPITEIYNHQDASPANLELDQETGILIGAVRVAGSTIGKKLTMFKFKISSNASQIEGTIYGRIWGSGSGITVKKTFSQTYNPPVDTDGWIDVTFTDRASTVTLATGDRVGIEWVNPSGGADEVYIQIDDANADPETGSYLEWNDSGTWVTDTTGAIVGVMETGSGSSGSAHPYIIMEQPGSFQTKTTKVAERFHSTATAVIGKIPTKTEVFMYRESVTSGTIYWRVWDASWNVRTTLTSLPYSSLPTVGATLVTFENLSSGYVMQNGDVMGFEISGVNSTGKVHVGYNLNNNAGANNFDGSNSYVKYHNTGWSPSSPTLASNDVSMKIYTGGTTFIAYMKFSQTVTRIYERCVTISSSFYDKPLSQVMVRGERTGVIPTEGSTLFCRVRDSSNNEKYTVGSIDANTIDDAALQDIVFTNNNNEVKIAIGDYVSIEIDGCDASNYIELNINKNVIDVDHSIAGKYDDEVITDYAIYDLAGEFFTGGKIDVSSRTRVGQYIKDQSSLFLNVESNKVTFIDFWAMVVGSPSGTIYINIRRGTDDSVIKTIGTIPISNITGTITAPTLIHVQDFTNTYNLEVDDKIIVEIEGTSDSANKIGILTRTSSPNYDGLNSYIAKYNGAVYDYVTDRDIVGTIKVGGNTYTPEAGVAPPVLPENSTDWYIGCNSDRNLDTTEKSIFNGFWFFTKQLSDTELMNLHINRLDTSGHAIGSLQVTNHSFIRNAT